MKMNRKFIIDKEVNLLNEDFLETKHYSNNLTRVIRNTEEGKVFTIGLFGSWGSGKSSIIETTKKEIEETKEDNTKFIVYDAWQYANDSFRRMFLRKIRKELGFEETELLKKFYENESADISNKLQLSTSKLATTLTCFIAVMIVLMIIPNSLVGYDYKFPIYSILSILSLLITIVSGSFSQLKVSITKPLFFAPEQFEDCFKQMISLSLKKYNWVKEKVYVICGVKFLRNLDKIVIVIDNIDRCNNDVAYQLLTDIKTFLGNENYNVVFIIPVDDEALRKHLFISHKLDDEDISVNEKEEFLRKFFNLTIRIKPYHETDMFTFVKKINEKYALGFNNATLMLSSKEYSTNPRRVLQLFNNLSSELSNYSEEFSKENESIICATLILKEEFGSHYKMILKNPSLLIKAEAIFSNPESESAKRINRFIRISQTIFSKANEKILLEILTNTKNIFNWISDEVKDAIESFHVEKIVQLYTDNSESITDYLLHQIRVQNENNLTDQLCLYFDIVAKINVEKSVSVDTNLLYNQVFHGQLSNILTYSKDYDILCKYALIQEQQGSNVLKNKSISFILDFTNHDAFKFDLFQAALSNYQDEKSCIRLSEKYHEFFEKIDYPLNKLKKVQFDCLINDAFSIQLINEVQKPINHSQSINNLITIFKNKSNITTNVCIKLFGKFVEIINDDRISNLPFGNLIKTIEIINSIICHIPDKILLKSKEDIEILYHAVFGARKKPNINYPNFRNYDTTVYLIDEALEENEQQLQVCIDFLINGYRISENCNSINDELRKLDNARDKLNPSLIKILNKGFSLNNLSDFILSDKNYNSTDSLQLIEHCLFLNDSNYYKNDFVSGREKINSLLEYGFNNKSQNISDLIGKLIDNEIFKNIIIEVLSTKTSEFINHQPKKVLIELVASFNKENANEYENNFPFLSAIANSGTENQNSILIRLLITLLENGGNIDQILNVIDDIKKVKSTDKNVLKSHLVSYLENNLEEINDLSKNKLEDQIRKLN